MIVSHFKRSAKILKKVVSSSEIHIRVTNAYDTISTSVVSEYTEYTARQCDYYYVAVILNHIKLPASHSQYHAFNYYVTRVSLIRRPFL